MKKISYLATVSAVLAAVGGAVPGFRAEFAAAAAPERPGAGLEALRANVAGKNYESFKVSSYIVVGSIGGRGAGGQLNLAQLETQWNTLSSQIKIDKVYIETTRDTNVMPEENIEPIKKFFLDKGVEVAGGMTLARNNSGQFTTFDYAVQADRDLVKRLSEMTAKHFDEIILDDFFFYNTKSDADIVAKGDKSWTQYRVETMREVAKDYVVGPAHAVNPKCRMVVKYPNWYEHFAANGFDLDQEPKIFDGVYSGTETRDPVRTEQHLQPYESYEIIRYFENIKPGGNGGGWVDWNQYNVIDRYAEQLWDSAFAKAREITLFSWGNLNGGMTIGNRPWANEKTSFQLGEVPGYTPAATASAPAAGPGGMGGRGFGGGGPSGARVASYALNQVDKVVHKLGNPVGVKSYRPPVSTGEDFLHNFLGMIGLPVEMVATYPEDAQTILLTEDARADKDIVKKMKASLAAGKRVIVTSGLVKSLQGKGIEDICELEYTGNHVPVESFHVAGGNPIAGSELAKPISFPEIRFITNDAWLVLEGMVGWNGYPIMLSDKYSKGTLYVLTIPDAYTEMYRMPGAALTVIRDTVGAGLPVGLAGATPAQVGVYEYDNRTFVLRNYTDEEKKVEVGVTGATALTNLLTEEKVSAAPAAGGGRGFGAGGGMPGRGGAGRPTFNVAVPAHSWVAFSY